jgi:hypothetical protein
MEVLEDHLLLEILSRCGVVPNKLVQVCRRFAKLLYEQNDGQPFDFWFLKHKTDLIHPTYVYWHDNLCGRYDWNRIQPIYKFVSDKILVKQDHAFILRACRECPQTMAIALSCFPNFPGYPFDRLSGLGQLVASGKFEIYKLILRNLKISLPLENLYNISHLRCYDVLENRHSWPFLREVLLNRARQQLSLERQFADMSYCSWTFVNIVHNNDEKMLRFYLDYKFNTKSETGLTHRVQQTRLPLLFTTKPRPLRVVAEAKRRGLFDTMTDNPLNALINNCELEDLEFAIQSGVNFHHHRFLTVLNKRGKPRPEHRLRKAIIILNSYPDWPITKERELAIAKQLQNLPQKFQNLITNAFWLKHLN